MNERKNIEQLFQEKFNQFEISPDEKVWENIEKELKKKQNKRKIVPFWFRFGGIAASLILGLWMLNFYIKNNTNTNPSLLNNDKKVNRNSNSVVINNESKFKKKQENSTILNSPVSENKLTKNENGLTKKSEYSSNSKFEKLKPTESDKFVVKTKKIPSSLNEKENLNSITQVDAYKNNKENSILKKFNRNAVFNSKKKAKTKTNKIQVLNDNDSILLTQTNLYSENSLDKKEKLNVNKQIIVFSEKNKNESDTKDLNIKKSVTTFKDEIEQIKEEKVIALKDNKQDNYLDNKSLKDKIEFNKIINPSKVITVETLKDKKLDSTKIAIVESNALEELLNEKEQRTKVEQKVNRWQVSPNIAPIYFGSTTNGSPLDERLSENNKEFSKNQGYGLGVSYGISKKVKIRSGINVLSLDYTTNGVLYSENSDSSSRLSSSLANLNPNALGAGIRIENFTNVNPFFAKIPNLKSEGNINQKMGYIEVPVEVSYNVLNSKFAIELIGGLSTLFLNRNDVMMKTPQAELKIGEASNLNKMHFSGNLGLGLKYNFIKNLALSVEPTFKYQINTFSADSGNFNPYIFGIYSGLNLSF